jgi:hypothetical protein
MVPGSTLTMSSPPWRSKHGKKTIVPLELERLFQVHKILTAENAEKILWLNRYFFLASGVLPFRSSYWFCRNLCELCALCSNISANLPAIIRERAATAGRATAWFLTVSLLIHRSVVLASPSHRLGQTTSPIESVLRTAALVASTADAVLDENALERTETGEGGLKKVEPYKGREKQPELVHTISEREPG